MRASGRYDEALAACDHAEAILAERNASRVAVAQLQRAQVWFDLGQHARAAQLLEAGLGTARTLPPRYAVRWLQLLARLKRRLKQDARSWFDEAWAAVPAVGWPELGLNVRTERALLDEAPAAALHAIAAEAAANGLQGAALGAWLHAAAIEPASPPALAAAQAALALIERDIEALHTDRALRWLNPAKALAAHGRNDAARALLDQGRAWLRATAATHVAPPFVDSFLHQQPSNLALATWRP
jgi:hypothetical protein